MGSDSLTYRLAAALSHQVQSPPESTLFFVTRMLPQLQAGGVPMEFAQMLERLIEYPFPAELRDGIQEDGAD